MKDETTEYLSTSFRNGDNYTSIACIKMSLIL